MQLVLQKQSILKRNNTQQKKEKKKEREREEERNQPTNQPLEKICLFKSFLEKKIYLNIKSWLISSVMLESFTDMNITIFRSQDFYLRSLEFGLFLNLLSNQNK